jgi:hypothetical protein
MAILDNGIYFLKPDQDKNIYDENRNNFYIDYIPLSEIKTAFPKQEKNATAETPSSPLVRKISLFPSSPTDPKANADEGADSRASTRYGHEFQIETFEEEMISKEKNITGECAGRVYHIRVNSKEKCAEVAKKIDKLAQTFRTKAEAKGRFEVIQQKMLRYYKSAVFQTVVAGLILTVRYASLLQFPLCACMAELVIAELRA